LSPHALDIRIVETLGGIDPAAWNALAGDHPMLSHGFLHALHETGCASAKTGWHPQFITARNGPILVGAMPLYLKSHSYGEYIFDWAWADAYQRNGLDYYPKLLSAIPFSPVGAAKLMAHDDTVRAALIKVALAVAQGASSLHVLFPTEDELPLLEGAHMLTRRGVQFHWYNDRYASFDDFLARFSHDKRKKIKQERRKVRDAGISFKRLVGADITSAHWAFFNRCYRSTYRAHHSTPYLNIDFFHEIGAKLPDNLLMVVAIQDDQPIAAAFNVFNDKTLYGRYWGTTGFHSGLHFETCYYQAIEFCIEQGIGVFEGGAQGEHKLARGFTPVQIRSAHWLKHPQFAVAIERFLDKESKGIAHYIDELNEHTPFKATDEASLAGEGGKGEGLK
jgi:uncharacterized protein